MQNVFSIPFPKNDEGKVILASTPFVSAPSFIDFAAASLACLVPFSHFEYWTPGVHCGIINPSELDHIACYHTHRASEGRTLLLVGMLLGPGARSMGDNHIIIGSAKTFMSREECASVCCVLDRLNDAFLGYGCLPMAFRVAHALSPTVCCDYSLERARAKQIVLAASQSQVIVTADGKVVDNITFQRDAETSLYVDMWRDILKLNKIANVRFSDSFETVKDLHPPKPFPSAVQSWAHVNH